LQNRAVGFALVGAAALHFGLVILGLPGWQCPIRQTLGIPCPGCGLSRAMLALTLGDWQTSLTLHAFAPLFLIGLLLMTGVTLLPSAQRQFAINWIDLVERRTGIIAILLISFVLYWLARLVLLREAFIRLIIGS
jgi:hypothetical protein